LLALTSVLVLAVAVAGFFGWSQAHRLASTRGQLATLRASAASEQAQVSALATTVDAQQKTLTDLGSRLGATQTQLATTQSSLGTTQSQLQTAQARLGTDEQQLSSTTKQLTVTTKQLPPDLVALATQVSPSVVLITCTTAAGGDTGTGFALSLPAASGYATTIITAEHVIDSCTNPSTGAFVSLARGGQTLPVHLRAYDPREDVAILDTTATLPTLKPAAAPVVGEFLMAVGNPLGVNDNVTSGNVSQVYPSYFLDTAPISNGSSGGPVVDRSGNVVGIVDAGAVADANTPVVQNLNIALRLSRLCPTVMSGSSCAALH
jgi:S1-C subfamily serine protease